MSRPIDADELIEKIRKLPNAGIKWFVSAEAVFDTILNAPPIEPERKKGHWIDTDNYYQRWKCSECGCHTRDITPDYCPNCGADMRGEL